VVVFISGCFCACLQKMARSISNNNDLKSLFSDISDQFIREDKKREFWEFTKTISFSQPAKHRKKPTLRMEEEQFNESKEDIANEKEAAAVEVILDNAAFISDKLRNSCTHPVSLPINIPYNETTQFKRIIKI